MPTLLLLQLACLGEPTPWEPVDLFSRVDVFVGTGGYGFGYGGLSPAATVPSGMVKVGPDTSSNGSNPGFNHSAGYNYPDTHIEGFSHHRLPGIGVGDGGAFRVMMASGPGLEPSDYRRPFSHDQEQAGPGFYAVKMNDLGQVELTASTRAAHHRYTWDEGVERWLILDLRHGGSMDCSSSEWVLELSEDQTQVSTSLLFSGGLTGRGGGLPLWAQLQLSQPWVEAVEDEGVVALRFEDDVELQLGLSPVDAAGAANNLATELPEWDFEGTQAAAEQDWREAMSSVRVHGGTPTEQGIYASALYHALLMPQIWTDADGRYPGFDGEIHQADGWTYLTDFSLWDTYRTLHPWVILAWPERARDHARSLAAMGEQGGFLPQWPAGNGDSGSMIGANAELVLAESLAKGVDDWPVEDSFELAWALATEPTHVGARDQLDLYLDYGFVPADLTDGSVSKTMEYAIDDSGLAMWAELLGRSEEAATLRDRQGAYAHVFDADSGFVRGRNSDGSWSELILEGWPEDFVEGNPWQYTFLVPHDPEGLGSLFDGGREAALARLDETFELSHEAEDTFLPDPYYWHGNEPDLHFAYMFAALGQPWRTDEEVAWIRGRHYALDPAGLDGNDDGGTMSAWYLFAAMGLYPLNGTDRYVISAPAFDLVEVDRPGGTLSVLATGEGPYLAGAFLDGEPLERAELSHEQLTGEVTLHLVRSPRPMGWGTW
jgi:predicted alpha-1,2-mannosidase